MATLYAVATGLWSAANTWDADAGGGSPGDGPPADGDTVIINAGVVVTLDGDYSAHVTGFDLTITSHATTPGELICKADADGTYAINIASGTSLRGTNAAALGKLTAGSSGTPLAFGRKCLITLLGTAKIDTTYLNIALYCTQPTFTAARTYGTLYKTDDGTPLSVDHTTDTFTRNGHGWADTTPVMFESSGDLPAPLLRDTLYWVVSSAANTFKVAFVSGGAAIDITSNGTGVVSVYSGHTNTATGVMNVLDDVTGDARWVTTAGHNAVVLADAGPANGDMQRVGLSTIAAGAITLDANVDSIQYPNARIYLMSRNVSIRFNGTQNAVDGTGTGAILQCEIRQTGAPLQGAGITLGTSHTVSGTISGCSYGVVSGTSHAVSGTISGCTYGIYAGTSHTVSGTISGCTYGIYAGTSHTVSGTISGCTYGINLSTSHTVSGTISGCYYGVSASTSHTVSGTISGCIQGIVSGTSHTVSGTISGCTHGVVSGTSHTVSGTISGCNYGINGGTSHTVSGTISGCIQGIYSGTAVLHGAILTGNTNDLNAVFELLGYGATLGSPVQNTGYLFTVNEDYRAAVVYDIATAGVPAPGQHRAWMPGGTVVTEAAPGTPPVALPYAYKHIPESATRSCFLDIPVLTKANTTLKIAVYIKADTLPSGMTAGPRVQLVDPDYAFNDAPSLLVDTAIADNTNWQTITVQYAPTTSRTLLLRVRGRDASTAKFWHWMYIPETGLGGGGPAIGAWELGAWR